MNHPAYIVIHCTDVSFQKLRDQLNSVNQYHRSQNFPLSRLGHYVGYHSLITGGKNYRTKLDSEEGAHTKGHNLESLGVCVGFDGDVEYPHPDDYILLQKQVWDWQKMYSIPDERVVFHRHFNTSKTCPGSLLDVAWLTRLLHPTPNAKPEDQEEKQKEILQVKISILQKLINLHLKLRNR